MSLSKSGSFKKLLKRSPLRYPYKKIQSFDVVAELPVPKNRPELTDSKVYHVFNVTTGEDCYKGLPPYFLPYFYRLCENDHNQMHKFFVYIIRENGWSKTDNVYAVGDTGDKIWWRDYISP